MKILNFGSLNIDYVYNVAHIVIPGETIASTQMETFPGGKGLNQTLAIARAGAEVYHAGMVGSDGTMLTELLKKENVNCEFIRTTPHKTGSAFIQVDKNGQNSIVLYGGANKQNTKDYVDLVLSHFGQGDIVLIQNEINCVQDIIQKAHEKEMIIVLNPSPFDGTIRQYDLEKVSMFIMNEHEGAGITGEKDEDRILDRMGEAYPRAKVVLTLGANGSAYRDAHQRVRQDAFQVRAVDTTAAGDTFTGYMIAALTQNEDVKNALRLSAKAAALAVTKKGAASSIPYIKDVLSF